MKNNFLLILVFAPLLSFGQSSCEEDKYFHYNYSTPGMHLLNDAINIKYSSRKDNNPNYRYANSIRSNIERDLLSSARMQVRQHLKEQKSLMLNRQKVFSKEYMLASAWSSSQTGIISGLSWYELSASDKNMYRTRYVNHFQGPRLDSGHAKSKTSPIEKEIAMAWGRSQTGQNDGRPWSQIPETEKKYYRNNYLARKESGLISNNQTMIAQREYKEAWLMLKNCGTVNKFWHQLSSVEKSQFRKDYTVMVNHNNGLLALR